MLMTNAMPVEIVLAIRRGKPKYVSKNNKPKSTIVLKPPTIAKRPICALFFMMRLVIFLDQIVRPTFGFVENSRDIFADHAEAD